MRIFLADCCLFSDPGGTTKADRHCNNRLFISLWFQQSSVKWCLFVSLFLSSLYSSLVSHLNGGVWLPNILFCEFQVMESRDWWLPGNVGQFTAGGTIWWLLLKTVLIISIRMNMFMWSFFYWLFMETQNKVHSLKRYIHVSFLIMNSNNPSVLFWSRSNVSKAGLCCGVNMNETYLNNFLKDA